MAAGSMNLQGIVGRLGASQLAAPILIIMVLAMMVLPLPPFLLDILFTFNIAVAVLVLMPLPPPQSSTAGCAGRCGASHCSTLAM